MSKKYAGNGLRAAAVVLIQMAVPASLHPYDYYEDRQKIALAALPYANLSEAVYSDGEPGGRWQVLDRKSDPTTGLKAATYGDSSSGKIVVAFAGTDFKDWHDRAADTDNYFRGKKQAAPDQYRQALEYVQKQAQECHCEPVVTGHSLGGGLAAYTASALGLEAWTFNPAGLGKSTYKDTKDSSRITNLMDLRDPVHAIDKGKTTNPGRKWQFDFESDGKGFERLLDKHKMSSFRDKLEQVSKGLLKPYRKNQAKAKTTGFGEALKKLKEAATKKSHENDEKKKADSKAAQQKPAPRPGLQVEECVECSGYPPAVRAYCFDECRKKKAGAKK